MSLLFKAVDGGWGNLLAIFEITCRCSEDPKRKQWKHYYLFVGNKAAATFDCWLKLFCIINIKKLQWRKMGISKPKDRNGSVLARNSRYELLRAVQSLLA
jgi:hypothetical protein